MSTIAVEGHGLDALAAAARLAKLGHAVSLHTAGAPLGGPAAARPGPQATGEPTPVDGLDPVITLPAAWRDLFTKSGRPLDPTLSSRGLVLVGAPATRHRFADGSSLDLPTGRADQLAALTTLVGRPAAERWTGLVDQLVELWQGLRVRGLERRRPEPLTGPDRDALWHGVSVDRLAERLAEPRLEALLRSIAVRAGGRRGTAPALLLTQACLDRTFGRWLLSDDPERADRPARVHQHSDLIAVLVDRLTERGVKIDPDVGPEPELPEPELAEPELRVRSLVPSAPAPRRRGLLGRRSMAPGPTPFAPPTVSHDWASAGAEPFTELVDHTDPAGPVITWTRRLDDQRALVTRHDHGHPGSPDPAWGLACDSFADWAARPSPASGDLALWGACSSAGNQPWSVLLGAALSCYRVHEQLTGGNARPDNPEQPQHRRGQVWLGDHITR